MKNTIEKKQTLIENYNRTIKELQGINHLFWFEIHCKLNGFKNDEVLTIDYNIDENKLQEINYNAEGVLRIIKNWI